VGSVIKRPPRRWWRYVGRTRVLYWRFFRSRRALSENICAAERNWSGKDIHPDDLASLVNDLKRWVPW